jgi:glycosyltransferase involved in cell wall biosynthesis
MDATVTVAIPTRNRSRWLRAALESALGQTYPKLRVVVSDNASTDDTAQVVSSFADARLAYHRSDVDVGMFGNLNRAV